MSDDNRKPCSSKEEVCETPNKKRGRRIKYHTDVERIEARRKQQKAYRERKRKELLVYILFLFRLNGKEGRE